MIVELTAEAATDLREIYRYSELQWGADQADRYLEALVETIERLGAYGWLGRDVSDIAEGLRRHIHVRHAIYYRVTDIIEVIRILHVSRAARPLLEPE